MESKNTTVLRIYGRRAALLVWIVVKLVLVSAMINQNVTQFIYAGF